MKKIFILIVISNITFWSCQKEIDNKLTTNTSSLVFKEKISKSINPKLMSKENLDNFIMNTIRRTENRMWKWSGDQYLWNALLQGDHHLAIGYKPTNLNEIHPIIHDINLKSAEWKSVKDGILNLVLEILNKNNPNSKIELADILIEDDPILPILTLKITDFEVIQTLGNLENVRYLEALDYLPNEFYTTDRSSSGCSGSSTSLNSSDYTTVSPSCKQPWNYINMNIPGAWTTYQSIGTNIKIGVIDAGISNTQSMLGANFNSGWSSGRSLTTAYTYGSSAYTSCAHGTSMSGLAVGPRNASGATSGISYKSSLYFIRGCDDVLLDESAEKTGVKNALTAMGNDESLRIISMSIGTPFYSSVLEDGVIYAYNKGKLIFAAAGTSFSWTSWWGVIYPAVHPQCVAMTGVKENGSTCTVCHDGSEVDFTVTMERNADSDRNSLSLALSGNTPTYIGGSSTATAMGAGIAGMVWGVKPTLTRAQVMTCLTTTAQFYPNKNSNKGYGNLNASAAVAKALTY